MPSQLKKLALIEEGSPDTVLNFSVVQEGAANASRQVIEIEPADGGEVSIENDRNLITSKRYDITVVGLYSSESDRSQLQTWASNQTDLNWSGIGLDGQILQGEGQVVFQEDYEDNVSFRFNRSTVASGGYSSSTGKHSSGLSYSKNGLALYQFADVTGNGEADGWVFSGGTTNFDSANGEQDFSTTAASGQTAYRQIWLPFENQFTFSVNFNAATINTGVNLLIERYDASDTLNNTTTQAVTGTGVESVSATLASDTAYIRCVVEIGQNDDVSFSEPVLGEGTYSTFREWNT